MNCLTAYKIDTVFHFAAQSHVDLSFGSSYRFTDTNVYGTHVLLEGAKEAKVARFIHVSTDEVHGEADEKAGDYPDDKRIHAPTNPYAASKAAAEMFVHAYRKSYNVPAIVVRMNNVYGPNQFAESERNGSAIIIHSTDADTIIRGYPEIHLPSESRKAAGASRRRDKFKTIRLCRRCC